ncbi:MAG: sugar phosphate nucleotidyltransferase [Candidatus Paceibacterota bacterium]
MCNYPKQAVILAAGESSRFWPLNSCHKSLVRIMGKPVIWHTINGLRQCGIEEITIVQSSSREIEKALQPFVSDLPGLKYAVQKDPLGMGDALLQVKGLLKGQFFLLNADRVDCGDIIKEMADKSINSGSKTVLLGQKTQNTWLYGIARLDGERISGIVEKPQKGKEPSDIRIVGIYLLEDKIFDHFGKTESLNDLEETLSLYMKDNDSRIVIVPDGRQELSLKYPWHLFAVRNYLFDKYLTGPKISSTACVDETAVIKGNVLIGENVKVLEGAVIKGPCYIGDNSIIGNNSVVREYCDLEEGAVAGAFSEVTRTIFQSDVHVHSGYFGDSIFDTGCRVGAGTVTANARLDRGEIKAKVQRQAGGEKRTEMTGTGLDSLGIIAGKNSKIGINVSLMPGRTIGKNCTVGPGTVLMENLQDGENLF